jgi:hypothetical protein
MHGLQYPTEIVTRYPPMPAGRQLAIYRQKPIVTVNTPEELEKMRIAGRLAAEVLEMIAPYVKPGISTAELDRICHD